MASIKKLTKLLKAYENRNNKLVGSLSQIGFIGWGNIQRRYLTFGKPYCSCNKNEGAKHGPYYYWTRKENKKIVSRMLKPQEAAILEKWIENKREFNTIIKQMQENSRKAFKVYMHLLKEKQNT